MVGWPRAEAPAWCTRLRRGAPPPWQSRCWTEAPIRDARVGAGNRGSYPLHLMPPGWKHCTAMQRG